MNIAIRATLIFLMLISVYLPVWVFAAEWVCPASVESLANGEWCDAALAEHKKEEADKRLNEVYKKFLTQFTPADRKPWIAAQRTWIVFFQADCSAISGKNAGSASTRQYVYQTCLTERIIQRIRELQSYCEIPECQE